MKEETTRQVSRVEHVFHEMADRWIYLEYDADNQLMGVNFMQGDDYEDFKELWAYGDKGLTKYCRAMKIIFPTEKASVSELNFISRCMDSWVEAICFSAEK
jgi:hypothetical protein